ncbi:MAG: SDR family oxidoreductase, partial [Streptomycetaceae bacterium]|nr:SDR family oxidoreductase [Streptomycetaceae bacterium]
MGLAVVTGASRGLGFESAKALASAGFDLAMIAKDPTRLTLAQQKLSESFPNQKFTTYQVDLEDIPATRAIAEKITSQEQTPEILMIAHGVMSEKMSKTLKTNDHEWRRVMSINLDSVFTLVNALMPAMVDARKGRVIIYSACLGRMSGPGTAGGLAPYRISKA